MHRCNVAVTKPMKASGSAGKLVGGGERGIKVVTCRIGTLTPGTTVPPPFPTAGMGSTRLLGGVALATVGLLALFYVVLAAEDITDPNDLQTCLYGLDPECVLRAGYVMSLSTVIEFNRTVILRGVSGSTIDLLSKTQLALFTPTSAISVTMVDLEVRNGWKATGSFFRSSSLVSLNLTRVVVRNMTSSSGSAIDSTGSASVLNSVKFINCTTLSDGVPAALTITDPQGWSLTDITIDNSLSPTAPAPVLRIAAMGAPALVQFGGNITVTGNDATNLTGFSLVHLAATSGGHNYPVSLTSNPNNPSTWSFLNYPRSAMLIASTLRNISFSAGAFNYTTGTVTSTDFAFSVLNNGQNATIQIEGALTVNGIGILGTSGNSAGSTVLQADSISASGPLPCSSVFYLTSPSYIRANNLKILDYDNSAIQAFANSNWTVSQAFQIQRSLSLAPAAQNAAIQAQGGTMSFTAGTQFAVSTHVRSVSSSGGGAVVVSAGAGFAVSAPRIQFFGNAAPAGGAIFSDGLVQLQASTSISFDLNNATGAYAGALHSSTNNLTVSAPSVTFNGNIALFQGGALSIPVASAPKFQEANFIGNRADSYCVAYFQGSGICSDLSLTTGTYTGNRQSGGNTGCNDYLCSDPPVSPPVYVPPPPQPVDLPPCTGAPPSTGTYNCTGGQWVSVGAVAGETVTIPPTSTIVINGDLSVSHNLVFTGLSSTVTINGGCLHINGSLDVTLSPQELETISKQSGSSRTVPLVSQNSSCASLTTLTINASKSSSSCHKIDNASTKDVDEGSRTTLAAVFKVNSSSCNAKWIVLGCVLGGVLVIVVILMLVVTFNSKAKSVVRPFWARKQKQHTL